MILKEGGMDTAASCGILSSMFRYLRIATAFLGRSRSGRDGLLVLALLTILLTAAGCGGGGEPSATATPTAPLPSPLPWQGPPPIDLAKASPDLTLFGGDADDYLADRFSLAHGDFNGDGIADILVGAPKADGPDNARRDAGEAYVIFGSPDIGGKVDMAKGQQDFTIIGANESDNLGFVVAHGDVNGDGIDDILVGARFARGPDGSRGNAGEVYVVFGSPTLGGTVDTAKDEQDFTIVGAEGGDYVGSALTAGDVNGDGVDDIITAALAASGPDNSRANSGEAYVVFGSPTLSGTVDIALGQQNFTILGAESGDFMPNFVASGDVNGDHIDDILLGASMADGPDNQRTDAGEAYVVPGASDLGGTLDLASDKGFLTIWGADANDWLGFYLIAADVNGDGTDDLIVGARNADGLNNARNNCGEVYLIFGSANLPSTLDIAQGQQDVTLIGPSESGLFGHSLAAGDINGDGIADVLVGAPTAGAAAIGRPKAGEILAFFSSTQWPATVDAALGKQDVAILGADAEDELGFSLASGDVNGDRKDDIIGGALLADGPKNKRPDSGEAYVFLSGKQKQ
jgi:hypothetical protein